MAATCTTVDRLVYVAAYGGDDIDLTVTLRDADGQPVDVDGWIWLAQIRDTDDTLIDEFTVTEVEPGVLLLSLGAADSAVMGAADYRWDLQATADEVRTLVEGRLRIRQDVSR